VAEISLAVEIDATPETVWDALVDWSRQGEWMLLTRVSGGEGLGAGIEAFTGIGPVGFLDTMIVSQWQPPVRCVVVHTGRVVRGSAAFEVEPLPGGRSRFVWSEWLVLPFGVYGELAFRIVRPVVVAGIRYSLTRFVTWAPTRRPDSRRG
jgi:hypothetical protein